MVQPIFKQDSLSGFFDVGFFQIPDYQRGYAWEEKQRSDLLEDLMEIPAGHRHFTGTIVLAGAGEYQPGLTRFRVFDVVDGQQRLTTCVILLRCIYERLRELGHADAEELNAKYLKSKGRKRLEIGGGNDPFFTHIVEGQYHLAASPNNRTESNLRAALEQFEAYVSKMDQDAVLDLLDRITQRLQVNIYEVEDYTEVGIVFEVMNDRGKDLSQLDKVKNLLLYSTYRLFPAEGSRDGAQSLVRKINDTWSSVFRDLEQAGRFKPGDEDQLLRMHWFLTYDPDVRLSNVYGALKSRIKGMLRGSPDSQDNVIGFLERYCDGLKACAHYYRWAYDPGSSPFRGDIKAALTDIQRLGIVATPLPALMASMHRATSEPDTMLRQIRLLEVMAFRVFQVGGHRSNTGRSAVAGMAHRYHSKKLNHGDFTAELRDLACSQYVTDQQMRSYLADAEKRNFYTWSGLRYFLYEYERHLVSSRSGVSLSYTWEHLKERVRNQGETIEHILPQTIHGVPYWQERFDAETHAANQHRLGNLVLTDFNSSLQNASFDRKSGRTGDVDRHYGSSGWAQERDLCDFPEWTVKEIAEREERLIEFALRRWADPEFPLALPPVGRVSPAYDDYADEMSGEDDE